MNGAEHGHLDGNTRSRGKRIGRIKKADPLDHTYYIQAGGDTRRQTDPRAIKTDSHWRATCDVCDWVGNWHNGYPTGPEAADADGHEHRTTSLGLPGRTLPELVTQTDREDPWTA